MLCYVKKLESADVQEVPTKAQAEALAMSLGESASRLLACQDAVRSIKVEISDIASDLRLVKWIVVVIVAGIIPLVAKALF